MKLTAELAGEQHELKISRDGSRITAEIDGRSYRIEARETGPGSYLLTTDERVYECRVDKKAGRRDSFQVYTGSRDYALTLTDPKRLRGAQSAGSHAAGTVEIVAPMPGKVVRVLVQLGDEVEAGAGIVVVEAMKMQNEMKSPKAGRVRELHATAGATVNAGEVLAVIE